jgi:class 3 adenylate cyclase
MGIQDMKYLRKKYNYLLIFFLSGLLVPVCLSAQAPEQQEIPVPLFNKLILGNDSVCFSNGNWVSDNFDIDLGKHTLSPIPFYLNSLYFEFKLPENSNSTLNFQYFLEGFDDDWLNFTLNNIKEYTYLDDGEYIFHARYLNAAGETGKTFSLNFRIMPPVYRSKIAYLIYVIFVALILWAIIRARTFQFAKERYKLERIINERTEGMVKEMDKIENLLTNVLPKDTADELKSKGKVAKKKYKMATVLFSDIQGFTKIAEEMNPEKLIDELDTFFFHFDSVAEKFNIEKIKTIGDAYMCAGGIPDKNRTNPIEVVLAAIEMQEYMRELKKEANSRGQNFWDIRIGIHTGPVIAGVVGQKKLSYDIWGDTVNTASRMESSGEAGKVNISGSTYEFVKEFFICEYRGKMPVKYKGEIDMYFVNGIRPELLIDMKGLPNEKFRIRLQLLRLLDVEENMLSKMENELPEIIGFHNLKHTVNVSTQVELISRAEGISDEEMILVQTAALFHDSGFLEGFENHKQTSCFYARDILPKYEYSNDQIETVCKLIMSTQIPISPANKLEKILCDANFAYLGRVDFIDIMKNQAKEMINFNIVSSEKEWFEKQIGFIKDHEFYTATARVLRDVSKEEQGKKLEELI